MKSDKPRSVKIHRKPEHRRTKQMLRWEDYVPWRSYQEPRDGSMVATWNPVLSTDLARAVYEDPSPEDLASLEEAFDEGRIFVRPLVLSRRLPDVPALHKRPEKLCEFIAGRRTRDWLLTQNWECRTPYHDALPDVWEEVFGEPYLPSGYASRPGRKAKERNEAVPRVAFPSFVCPEGARFATMTAYASQSFRSHASPFFVPGGVEDPLGFIDEHGSASFRWSRSRFVWVLSSPELRVSPPTNPVRMRLDRTAPLFLVDDETARSFKIRDL